MAAYCSVLLFSWTEWVWALFVEICALPALSTPAAGKPWPPLPTSARQPQGTGTHQDKGWPLAVLTRVPGSVVGNTIPKSVCCCPRQKVDFYSEYALRNEKRFFKQANYLNKGTDNIQRHPSASWVYGHPTQDLFHRRILTELLST